MRIRLYIPNPLLRHLKARAALESKSLRDVVLALLQRSLSDGKNAVATTPFTDLPSASLGAPMALSADELSNASLSVLLDA